MSFRTVIYIILKQYGWKIVLKLITERLIE